jgi:hypothetical protein
LSSLGRADKSVTYTVLRHPQSHRKDRFCWPGAGDRPPAERRIRRLGDLAPSAPLPAEELALRMPPGGELATAGVTDGKFGDAGNGLR